MSDESQRAVAMLGASVDVPRTREEEDELIRSWGLDPGTTLRGSAIMGLYFAPYASRRDDREPTRRIADERMFEARREYVELCDALKAATEALEPLVDPYDLTPAAKAQIRGEAVLRKHKRRRLRRWDPEDWPKQPEVKTNREQADELLLIGEAVDRLAEARGDLPREKGETTLAMLLRMVAETGEG